MAKDGYPRTQGTPMKSVLPDWAGPLNVEATGDKLVPPNDMGGVAGSMSRGTSVPDPNSFVTPIEKSRK